MKRHSALERKLVDITYFHKEINKELFDVKRSWNEIKKDLNTKDCGKSGK